MADCYCHTCHRTFHSLGIARHRAMHRDRREDCEIEYSDGTTYKHSFTKRTVRPPKSKKSRKPRKSPDGRSK